MSGVILVRHAMPEIERGVSSKLWALGDSGREDCVLMAHALPAMLAPVVYASAEPKARQTADVIALRRGLRVAEDARLGEVDRPTLWDVDYRALVLRYLSGEQHEGWEPREAVVRRFAGAITDARNAAGGGDLVVVNHGMALSLWAASVANVGDLITFWQQLTFPDAWRIDPDAGTAEHLYLGGIAGE